MFQSKQKSLGLHWKCGWQTSGVSMQRWNGILQGMTATVRLPVTPSRRRTWRPRWERQRTDSIMFQTLVIATITLWTCLPPIGGLVFWAYSGMISLFLSLQDWFTVYEHNRRPNCTASDLIMGNEYMFRVYSENLCGLSEEPCHSKNTAVIAKTGVTVCLRVYAYVHMLRTGYACVCVFVFEIEIGDIKWNVPPSRSD